MGVFMIEEGWWLAPSLKSCFNAKQFDIGLRQKIPVSNHMCQCCFCFMEYNCSFMGLWYFMVDLRGFIDSKECWNSMFWTSVLHGQPVGSDKKPKTNISTIIADIWTKFDLCIDRGEARGGLLFTKIVGYHIPCWINLYECIDYIYYRNECSVTGVLVRVGNENIIFPWNSVSKMTVVSNSASYQLNVLKK